MNSSLPTESASDYTVDQFGLGTYDSSDPDEEPDYKSHNRALPDDGGPIDPGLEGGPNRLAVGLLPGDSSAPTSHKHDNTDTLNSPLTTVSESKLPGVSRNDVSMHEFWSAFGYTDDDISDSGGFPTYKDHSMDDKSSGGVVFSFDNRSHERFFERILLDYERGKISIGGLFDCLSALNNKVFNMTGKSVGYFVDTLASEDSSSLEEREKKAKKNLEEVKRDKEEHRKFMDRQKREERQEAELKSRARKATNLSLVSELTDGFLKEYGKKDLTKRHVLSYLQSKGHPQFISSDIVRCLKHKHKLYVADVLDKFPVSKKASDESKNSGLLKKIVGWIDEFLEDDMTEAEFARYLIEELEERKRYDSGRISTIRDAIIALEIRNMTNIEVSSILRRTAATLAIVEVDLEKFEDTNG